MKSVYIPLYCPICLLSRGLLYISPQVKIRFSNDKEGVTIEGATDEAREAVSLRATKLLQERSKDITFYLNDTESGRLNERWSEVMRFVVRKY